MAASAPVGSSCSFTRTSAVSGGASFFVASGSRLFFAFVARDPGLVTRFEAAWNASVDCCAFGAAPVLRRFGGILRCSSIDSVNGAVVILEDGCSR